MTKEPISHLAVLICASIALFGVNGCTSTEESDTVSLIQGALTDLTQNKSLAEQFVKDVKTAIPPGDPVYEQVQNSYETARDANNHFLDVVESGEKSDNSKSIRTVNATTDAREAITDFLADATSALKPSIQTRHIPFQRAVVIPDDIPRSLKKLRKDDREALVGHVDKLVRWKSWGQL